MLHKILFICTGNYYRSRYAEHYFNNLALKQNLNWRAVSRGLATELSGNIGSISPSVLIRLKEYDIHLETPIRFPIQLAKADLQEADIVIALNKPEHQELMQQLFPEWVDRIVYWHIPDLDQVSSDVAFSKIEQHVNEQLQHLGTSSKKPMI
jgi:low molecular weight protein-tyrosine phosphatase